MGYRSDVAYKITFHNKDQWNVFLIEAKAKPETRLCFEDNDMVVDHDKCEIRFLAHAVKWYSDYPEVKCHDLLLELVDEYDQRDTEGTEYIASYLFRRIGESDDDCEERFGGEPDWDDIYLSRSLVVSWA